MTCTECSRPAGKFIGLCAPHYSNFLADRRGSPRRYAENGDEMTCHEPGCEREIKCNALCNAHYQMAAKGGPTPTKDCPIPGCSVRIFSTTIVCRKHRQFMWRYSIPLDRCINLHEKRNYFCSNQACNQDYDLHMDHDHSCCSTREAGKVSCGECVRGWLCASCNRALGCIKDSPQMLRGLINYLER